MKFGGLYPRLAQVWSVIGGMHGDSDERCTGGSVSLDPSGTWESLGYINKGSSASKVKETGQKHDCPSMTLSR